MASSSEQELTVGLMEQIARVRNELDKWADNKKKSFDRITVENNENYASFNATVLDLNEKLNQLDSIKKNSEAKIATQRSEVNGLFSSITDLEARKNSLPPAVAAAAQLASERSQVLETKKIEVAATVADVNYIEEELARAVSRYQSCLGLTFQRIDEQHLRVEFTLLHRFYPQRPASFTLRLDERNAYNVTSVEPAVPAMPSLLATLNADNDFGRFVKAMRREFKAIFDANV